MPSEVMTVVLVIWIGIALFLYRLDRKLKKIEGEINMISNMDDYLIAIGGDYGITCEEIDEKKVSKYLDNLESEIILTGEVGSSINEQMKNKCKVIENYNDVYDIALKNNKNLLFIYRSDYRKLKQR